VEGAPSAEEGVVPTVEIDPSEEHDSPDADSNHLHSSPFRAEGVGDDLVVVSKDQAEVVGNWMILELQD
jgi:hypothetical protein